MQQVSVVYVEPLHITAAQLDNVHCSYISQEIKITGLTEPITKVKFSLTSFIGLKAGGKIFKKKGKDKRDLAFPDNSDSQAVPIY